MSIVLNPKRNTPHRIIPPYLGSFLWLKLDTIQFKFFP